MASRLLLPAGLAIASLGRFAWQIVFVLQGDSFSGNVRGFGAALGLALAAWAARDPERWTGPLAAGVALAVAMDVWVIGANLEFAGPWMAPFGLSLAGLLVLAWTAFTTAPGAWGRTSARGAAFGTALALAGSIAWLPLNLAPDSLAFLGGTALSTVGYGLALVALLPDAGVALPKIAPRRPRRAQS